MCKKKKILLLGSNGFIGKNLFKELKKSYQVTKFGNRKKKTNYINYKNLKNLKYTYDFIINCAGDSVVRHSYKTKKNNDLNIVLSILKFIYFDQPQAKFIQISTSSVFGNSLKLQKLKPISPYATRKLSCEKFIQNYSRKKKIDFRILRFFSVYGNGNQKQLFWDTCEKIKKKDYTFFGNGEEIRSWMHISDFCKIVIKVLKLKKQNLKIYNFCGNQIIKNRDLLTDFFKYYGVKSKPYFNGIINKGNPNFMYTKKCDLKEINFKQKTSLKNGIINYIKWQKKKSI